MLCLLALSIPRASAQTYSGWFGWFSFIQSEWIDWYVADDSSEEGILLTEVPDEFGDSFARGGRLTITSLNTPDLLSSSDVVLAGGSRGLKIGEHNKAIPMNRVYLTYNHFHNAVAAGHEEPRGTPVAAGTANLDRYLFGVESRFGCGLWSAELRMPLSAGYEFAAPVNRVTYVSGEVGNLSLILKRLLYYDGCTSVVAGVGIETPTGSGFSANVASTPAVRYRVANDAFHLHPYVGVLRSATERFFWHGFLQLDVAANGNRLLVSDLNGTTSRGRLVDPTLVYVDLSAGCWLYRDRCADVLAGVAGLVELHYTGALNDTSSLTGAASVMGGTGPQTYRLANDVAGTDVLNLTTAVHLELFRATSLRVGAVFPLTSQRERFFDSEISAQLIRRF